MPYKDSAAIINKANLTQKLVELIQEISTKKTKQVTLYFKMTLLQCNYI